jgi:hypothetical protein
MSVQYVQRSRKKGAKLPPNTICCTRPGRYGNPFTCGGNKAAAVRLFQRWLFDENEHGYDEGISYRKWAMRYFTKLIDADYLACWCKPGTPCHVQDVLIPAVNAWLDKGAAALENEKPESA